ncbi:MarR family winged helix-turn-helix transcriptional regulator [Texcoconibacillus texcoconensis]|uniref:MarR family protease production transcriptional regulator HPr n=1 Tax=Texcoconibacillus texcoconensis TaxID=1095777 RepID=A0A840QNS1_9BACI|nr:MarR family transcriptional regulator [Texcoconibacillus texcoconensis]MBB5173025.1 MarR family protease production transcriptional regulator HPr [Texcoconibacillus texcoconensis]
MTIDEKDHLLLNYIRGFSKYMEDEWQANARSLGLTLAEQHLLWIVHLKENPTISTIAVLGLWDRSTVMQVIKRLQRKGLVDIEKDEKDLRVSYVLLTEEGKRKREQSRHYSMNFFEFIENYRMKHPRFYDDLIAFHREANRYFHGEQFVHWVEKSSENFHEYEKTNG